jgi:hypothetical protein
MMHVFETPGRAALRVGIQAGQIELETWEAPRLELEVTPLRSDDASRAAVEELQIGSRERADGVTEVFVEQAKRRGGFLQRGPKIGVRVHCPHGTAVETSSSSADVNAVGQYGDFAVKTQSGDIAIDAVGGACRVNSVSGDVKLGTAEGGVNLETVSGDVRVGVATGPVTAKLVSGDATVLDARGALTVETVSGDQVIEASGGGDIRLQSVSGDVRVGIRPGLRLYVDASSVSGELSSELDASEEAGEGSAGLVRVRTISGDVSIVRALGASV